MRSWSTAGSGGCNERVIVFQTAFNMFQRLLPYERFQLHTLLTASEVIRRIGEATQPITVFSFSNKNNKGKLFSGYVMDDSFRIHRMINYRNSFLPQLNGSVLTQGELTLVRVRMHPAGFVLAFMGIWLGVTGLVCLLVVGTKIFGVGSTVPNDFSAEYLTPFGMFAFGYLLVLAGYKFESKPSKESLRKLLEATEIR